MDLLEQLVIAHLDIPKSMPAHSQYLSSLFSCVYSDESLLVITTRSSAYATELMVVSDVPNVYPFLPLCNHFNRDSRNIINR